MRKPFKISVGVMLWNEESSIGMTLNSLFQQSVFQEAVQEVDSIEVIVLANGCTDQSVPNAWEALSENLASLDKARISGRVEELPKGRSPAWNRFVHEIAAADSDYMILMDADIIIDNRNAIHSMVDGLSKSEYHPVAGAFGIKDVDLQKNKTLLQKVSSAMTRMEHDARFFYLCGGLYCGKSSFFRRFVFPEGFICGDDGFIATMAITNFLTTDYEFDRILHPEDASFVFEAYSTLPKLFRQNRRRLIGARVRQLIEDYVRSSQSNRQPDAGTILMAACEKDPQWLVKLTEKMIAESGFWVVPQRAVFYRLTQLRHLPFLRKICRLPLALAATVWQCAIVVSANRVFQRREHMGAWTNMQNTRMRNVAVPASPAQKPK